MLPRRRSFSFYWKMNGGTAMATKRHVWQGFDADVNLYLEDEDTGEQISGGPILTYCYWENFSISATLAQTRRPVTGRTRLKIVNAMWQYTASVAHMYFRKSEELRLSDVFNRQQPLQIELALEDTNYTGEAPQENDTHLLRRAFSNSFQITGRSAEIIEAKASFSAEEFDGDFT